LIIMICPVIYIVILIFLIIIGYVLLRKLLRFIYHVRHPDIPRVRRKLLFGYLVNKYGKREGKKLFKEFTFTLWKKFKIK